MYQWILFVDYYFLTFLSCFCRDLFKLNCLVLCFNGYFDRDVYLFVIRTPFFYRLSFDFFLSC